MVSFFERKGAYVRFESRAVDNRTDLFELIIRDADGSERREVFKDSEMLLRRQIELERGLEHDGWQGPFGRVF